MKPLAVKMIAHTALKVADLERSLAFYRDTLGFAEMLRINFPDSDRLMLVYLRMTDTQYLELFPGGEGNRAPGPDTTAIHHFCLEVDDLKAVAADLEERGVELTIKPQIGLDHNWQCWIEDPDGNRIEIMQMMPGCLQEQAIKRLSGIV